MVASRMISLGVGSGWVAAMGAYVVTSCGRGVAAVLAYDPLPALFAYPGPRLLADTPPGEQPESLHPGRFPGERELMPRSPARSVEP